MTKSNLMRPIFTLAIFASLLLTTSYISTVSAEGEVVGIQPALVSVGPTIPTPSFRVNITVQNVANLMAWQINVTFDPAILDVVDLHIPAYDVFAGLNSFEIGKIIDNTRGSVVWASALMYGEPLFSGSGVLCQIEFIGASQGVSSLTLISEAEATFGTKLEVIPGGWGNDPISTTPEFNNGSVDVYPEFPAALIAPILMLATIVALISRKKLLPAKYKF